MSDGIPCLMCGGWISRTSDSLTRHAPDCPVISKVKKVKPQDKDKDEKEDE